MNKNSRDNHTFLQFENLNGPTLDAVELRLFHSTRHLQKRINVHPAGCAQFKLINTNEN
ncbi:hypothetical protein SAMN04488084_102269 [Pedobacter antarcticus]|nr:hypothetical protein SAMN04488084_102269 [Pedobacter antarcticus]